MPQPLLSDAALTPSLWPLLTPAALGLAAVFLLLPRPRPSSPLVGGALGAVALLLAGFFWTRGGGPAVEIVLFYAFSGLALTFGALLVTQYNPVRAALSFALVVLSTCGLFLLQAAPFLMAATIIVYAGAIVVTFMFVIMLAQQSGYDSADHRSHESFLASLGGFVLLGSLLYVLGRTDIDRLQAFPVTAADDLILRGERTAELPTVDQVGAAIEEQHLFADFRRLAEADRGSLDGRRLLALTQESDRLWDAEWKRERDVTAVRNALNAMIALGRRIRSTHGEGGRARPPAHNVAALGRTLFTDYFLAVELGGTLLLVATVGAIAIAGRREGGR